MKIVLISADGLRGEPFEHPGARYFVRAIMPPFPRSLTAAQSMRSFDMRSFDIHERKYEMAEWLDVDTYAFREVYEAPKPSPEIVPTFVSKIDRNRGEVTCTMNNLEDVVNFEIGMWIDLPLEATLSSGSTKSPAAPALPAERVCSVCSKNCDVGLPCWCCGAT